MTEPSKRRLARRYAMGIEQTVTRVREDGWEVVPGIIPGDEVAGLRQSVLATI